MGESTADALVQDFVHKACTQAGLNDSILLSITSDTTGNMNRFGFAMEDAGVHHI